MVKISKRLHLKLEYLDVFIFNVRQRVSKRVDDMHFNESHGPCHALSKAHQVQVCILVCRLMFHVMKKIRLLHERVFYRKYKTGGNTLALTKEMQ